MRRFISTALLAFIAVSCGPGDSAAPAAPDEPTPTATVSPDADEPDVPETEPTGVDESEPQPAYDTKADLATAQSLVDAWLAADLPLGEVRDNTEKQCPDRRVGSGFTLTTELVKPVATLGGQTFCAAGSGGSIHTAFWWWYLDRSVTSSRGRSLQQASLRASVS